MFNRLKLYTVHAKKSDDGDIVDVKFVREGFNWWAFFFNMFWSFFNRCWMLMILSIAIFLVTEHLGMDRWFSYASIAVIQIGGFVIVGMIANDELRESLEKRGYTHSDTVSGESKINAKQRYFDRLGGVTYPWQTS